MVYGIYASITQTITNIELYLLFIFATFGFYVEFLGVFNAMDQSDNLIYDWKLKDDEC